MNRKQMEFVIAEGGSVLFNGRIITNIDDLPSNEEIFKDNPAALESVNIAHEVIDSAMPHGVDSPKVKPKPVSVPKPKGPVKLSTV